MQMMCAYCHHADDAAGIHAVTALTYCSSFYLYIYIYQHYHNAQFDHGYSKVSPWCDRRLWLTYSVPGGRPNSRKNNNSALKVNRSVGQVCGFVYIIFMVSKFAFVESKAVNNRG